MLTIVVGALLHCAAFAAADVTRARSHATEIGARPRGDANLAFPCNRGPEAGKAERILRVTASRHTSAARDSVARATAVPRCAIHAPPVRARSHTLRLRPGRGDDPPQPSSSI